MEARRKGQGLELLAEGREPLAVARVWGAVIWPAEAPGYALAAAQTRDGAMYCLAERRERDWRELVRWLASTARRLAVSRWLVAGGAACQAFCDRANRLAREEHLTPADGPGRRTLGFAPAPHTEAPAFALGLARDLLAAGWVTVTADCAGLGDSIKGAAALPPAKVLEGLAGELLPLASLVMLAAAADAWPVRRPEPPEPAAFRPRDTLTGI